MPFLDVLRTATTNAARYTDRQEHVGAIETGRFGDMIAVEGEFDAKQFGLFRGDRRPEYVVKSGAVVAKKGQLLEENTASAAAAAAPMK